MSDTAQRCPACRADLTESGHDPGCQDKNLTQPELKRLLKNRPGKPQKTETISPTGRVEWEAYQVSAEEDLKTIIDSPYLTSVTTGLLRELAALVRMADANRAAQTDTEGRYREVFAAMPSFTPAEAHRRIGEVEDRLYREVEKLSGATRNPHDPQDPQCVDCGRRATVVDSYCQPCGSRILSEHRRVASEQAFD